MRFHFALVLVASCSNQPTPPVDAGPTYRDGAYDNCVKPGTKGNEANVGGYCEVQSDCPIGTLCTGLFGAPADDWFCSKLCDLDAGPAVCGSGAMCVQDPRGIACVPLICIGDAGASDATDEDAPEASDDAALD